MMSYWDVECVCLHQVQLGINVKNKKYKEVKKMMRKIVGLCVVALMILVAVSSATGSMDTSKNSVFEKGLISTQISTSCYQIEVWQNGVLLGTVEPYTGPKTGVENYGYSSSSAHPYNGPTPKEKESKLYFYDDSDGLSLGIIHNVDKNYGFCQLNNEIQWDMTVTGCSPTVLLSDENEELSGTAPVFIGNWKYNTYRLGMKSNTDGGVIGDFSCGCEITINPISWSSTGEVEINTWDIYSIGGSSINLDMSLATSLVVKCLCRCAWSGNTGDTWTVIGPINLDIPGAYDVALEFETKYWLESGSYVNFSISADNDVAYDYDEFGKFDGVFDDCSELQFDLSAYLGETIYLKFEYYHGSGQVGDGFFIDNIKLYDPSNSNVYYSEDFNIYNIGDIWNPSPGTSNWDILGLEVDMVHPSNFLYLFGTPTSLPLCMPVMVGGIVASVIIPTAPCCCFCCVEEVRFYVDDVHKSTVTSAPYEWDSGVAVTQFYFQKKTIKIEVVTQTCTLVQEKTVCCFLC